MSNVTAVPSLLDSAITYARLGWFVLPLKPNSNKPATPHGKDDATTDEAQIRRWWGKWPSANIGVNLQRSGLMAVDIDRHEADGFQTLAKLEARYGPLRETLTATTPRQGEHRIYRCPPDTRLPSKLGLEIDVRHNGYIVLAPSHRDEIDQKTGKRITGDYCWKNVASPLSLHPAHAEIKNGAAGPKQAQAEVSPPEKSEGGDMKGHSLSFLSAIPGWFQGRAAEDRISSPSKVSAIGDGTIDTYLLNDGRKRKLASIAGALRRQGSDFETIRDLLLTENEKRCVPPLSEDGVIAIAASITKLYAPDDWPDPRSLPEETQSEIPDLDSTWLPPTIRDWCADIANVQRLPLAVPVCMALVALATVVGRRRQIQPKEQDTTWTVTPNLYGAVVMPPGFGKSPSLNAVMKPIFKIDGEWKTIHQEAMKDYKRKHAQFKLALNRALKKDEPLPDEPPLPIRKRLYLTDATPEKLLQVVSENPFGVLNIADELSAWFSQMDKAGRESERGMWIKGWDGNTPHSDDRMGREGNAVDHFVLNLWGNLQPDLMRRYLREVVVGGMKSDGLQQRLQIAIWPELDMTVQYVDRAPDPHNYEAVNQLFRAFVDPAYEFDSPQTLKFDAAAQRLFVDWWIKLEMFRSGRAGQPSGSKLGPLNHATASSSSWKSRRA